MAFETAHSEERGLLMHTNGVLRAVHSVWSNFIDFLGRDNVLEVALGLMIATSFTSVVNSLVSNILLPPISLLPFMSHKNLPEKFFVLRMGPNGQSGYNTLKQAAEDGAVTMAYGVFMDKCLTFLCLGLVLYGLAQMYGFLSKDSIIKATIKCPYCRKSISEKARRCVNCTSWVDGREDRETSALAH